MVLSMDGSGGQVVEINLHIHLWNRCNITKFNFFFCNNLKAAISFMDCFMLRTVSSGLSIVSWHHDLYYILNYLLELFCNAQTFRHCSEKICLIGQKSVMQYAHALRKEA
jgi:hypothetical protein